MDFTVITYLLYLAVTIPLTLWVAKALHRHGETSLVDVFQGDVRLASAVNQLLVIMGDRDFAGPPDPLVDALPDAHLVTLPGVDHFRAIREFRCIDAALEFIEAV